MINFSLFTHSLILIPPKSQQSAATYWRNQKRNSPNIVIVTDYGFLIWYYWASSCPRHVSSFYIIWLNSPWHLFSAQKWPSPIMYVSLFPVAIFINSLDWYRFLTLISPYLIFFLLVHLWHLENRFANESNDYLGKTMGNSFDNLEARASPTC